jgi:hypothetical protein
MSVDFFPPNFVFAGDSLGKIYALKLYGIENGLFVCLFVVFIVMCVCLLGCLFVGLFVCGFCVVCLFCIVILCFIILFCSRLK